MLLEIKRYLQKNQRATLNEMAIHFDTEPETMRGMLQQWVHKGKVTRFDTAGSCAGSCPMCRCGDALETYEWRN